MSMNSLFNSSFFCASLLFIFTYVYVLVAHLYIYVRKLDGVQSYANNYIWITQKAIGRNKFDLLTDYTVIAVLLYIFFFSLLFIFFVRLLFLLLLLLLLLFRFFFVFKLETNCASFVFYFLLLLLFSLLVFFREECGKQNDYNATRECCTYYKMHILLE